MPGRSRIGTSHVANGNTNCPNSIRTASLRRAQLGVVEATEAAASATPAIAAIVLGAAATSLAQLSRTSSGSTAAIPSIEEGAFFGSKRWVGRTFGIALVWVALLTYALKFAPGTTPEAREADQVLLGQILSTPFDGTVSPLFVCVFNMLGIWPVIYSATLLPGAKQQSPLPAWPFVAASFFLGAFALSPYLAIREYRGTQNTSKIEDVDWVTQNILETKWNALLLFAGALYLTLFALGNGIIGGFAPGDAWITFLPLFMSSLTAHVSCIDFLVLWMFYSPVLLEDGRRRGSFLGSPSSWSAEEVSIFTLCAGVPVFGGALWLLLRPQLPKD